MRRHPSGAGGFDEPANIQMEPTRSSSCANHVAAARGSFGTLDSATQTVMKRSDEELLDQFVLGVQRFR